MRRSRLVAIGVLILIFASFTPIAARADIVSDVTQCDPVAYEPTLDLSQQAIFGRGSTRGSGCAQSVDYVEVCLDLAGVTYPGSCHNHSSPSGGYSNGVGCLPGAWESNVTVHYYSGAFETKHSSETQGILIVSTQCR
ncbi:MAG: hypothetical protein QOG54_109 [Actinomycetota bacterium]|jgi:hypothetical protein|nr:hypothetical protein [Actinomycetota bacterium]